MNRADQEAAVGIMRDHRFCMLTTFATEGELHSHPMTPQQVEDSGDAWFFLDATSETARNLAKDPRINLAFGDDSSWLSVAGTGTVRDDRSKIDELWNSMVEAWFPEGKDSPDLRLLRIEASSAQFWDTPGGKVASALSFVRTKVTGKRPAGESDSVELGGA
ncbi:hypothetical protein ASG90_00910 [Nocardioides sp. Soil797]|nr:hypothetical protein ASG90_00910 [Nocardioides sp. Soil797]